MLVLYARCGQENDHAGLSLDERLAYKDLIAQNDAKAKRLALNEEETKEYTVTAAAVYEDFFNLTVESVRSEYGCLYNQIIKRSAAIFISPQTFFTHPAYCIKDTKDSF